MVQSTTTDIMPDKAAKSSDLLSLLAGVGFAMFWAVVVNLILDLGLVFANFLILECLISIFAFFLGFLAVQFFSYTRVIERHSDADSSVKILVITAVLVVPYVVCFVLNIVQVGSPSTLIIASWLCFGVSAGLLLPGWGTLWTGMDAVRPDNHATALYISLAVIGSVVLCVTLFFMPAIVRQVAVAVLYFGSIMLLLFCIRQLPAAEFIDIETSQKHLKLFSRMMLSPFIMGLSFGVILSLSLWLFGPETSLLAVFSGLGLSSIAMIIVLAAAHHVPRHSTIERWCIPTLAVLLVVSILLNNQQFMLTLFILLIADISFSFISHWNVLGALSYRHHLHTVYHYAQGLIAPTSGVFAGVGVSTVVVIAGAAPQEMLFAAFLGILLLFVLVPAISPYASNKIIDTVFEEATDDEMSGSWRIRCQNISSQYALSPREVEVFKLLAKGRNAEHVSKTLVVSVHTAKTHISRIYRKLDINSQQELINLVDQR